MSESTTFNPILYRFVYYTPTSSVNNLHFWSLSNTISDVLRGCHVNKVMDGIFPFVALWQLNFSLPSRPTKDEVDETAHSQS